LRDLAQFVDEIANIRHNPRQPWVGASAFAHKGGMHVNAVQKIAHSFEHIDPAEVGNVRRVLVSDLAGRSNIVLKARELGFNINNNTPELSVILARIKELEHDGYEFEVAEASLALIISKILKHKASPFTVDAYHVSMRRDGTSSVGDATIKVRVDGQVAHTVAEGDGPVNAIDTALRLALTRFYPNLPNVRVTDYKVRTIESSPGTAAKTRVLIQSAFDQREWITIGVSENIVEASLQALVDSMEYALMVQPNFAEENFQRLRASGG
jgi:2-isopropylmalate synthase